MSNTRSSPGRRVLVVVIDHLDSNAAGVARRAGHRIAVPKTLPGERVRIEYDPARPRKSRIGLLEILEPARERLPAPCPHFDACGGCHLQHLPYVDQLDFKRKVIGDLLAANPRLSQVAVEAVEPMPDPFRYRNKSQMPFQSAEGRPVFGLFRQGTHELIPVDDCPIESRDALVALRIVRQWAADHHVPIYDEATREGLLRHVVVRKSVFSGQVMVVLVATARELPRHERLLGELKAGLSGLASVYLNINPAATNVILGEESLPVFGEPFIREQVGHERFRIYPDTFFQINSVQTVRILERLKELAACGPEDVLVDLYCGVGALSLWAARAIEMLHGVEVSERSVACARDNAADNGIRNAHYRAGDALTAFHDLLAEGIRPSLVLLDPPRKGAPRELIEAVAEARPRAVLYLSCNPKTLIRDLGVFAEGGYRAETIYPFDLFPQTHHVEGLVRLTQ